MGEEFRHVLVMMASSRKGHEIAVAGVIHEAPEIAERCPRKVEQDHQARHNYGPHVLREFRSRACSQYLLKSGEELLRYYGFHVDSDGRDVFRSTPYI